MLKQLVVSIISFIVIDLAWIALVVMPMYQKGLKEGLMKSSPAMLPAVIFYLIFNIALWFLVMRNHSGDMKETLIRAFVFGIATYSTYALTNVSLIDGWGSQLVVPDILWGGVLAVAVCWVTLTVAPV